MSTKQKDVGWSPAHDRKFFVQVFRLCETFFANFLNISKGSPFIFSLFCKTMDVQKLRKAPLLHLSALCDLPETKKNFEKKFQKTLDFFQFFPQAGTVEENT